MATQFYRFNGKVSWARVHAEQLDTKFNDEGEWKLDFYPEDVPAFLATGIQTQAREAVDGTFFKLKRGKFLTWKDKKTGERKEFEYAPAAVTIRTDAGVVPYTGTIGNGSSVNLTIAVFDTRKGKGHRFESLLVTNLVEYVKPDLPDVPEDAGPGNLDDGIPF